MAKTTIIFNVDSGPELKMKPTTIRIVATTTLYIDGKVTLPAPASVLIENGTGSVQIEASPADGTWAWTFQEFAPGYTGTPQARLVPQSETPVYYADLPEVISPPDLGFGPTFTADAQEAAARASLVLVQVKSVADGIPQTVNMLVPQYVAIALASDPTLAAATTTLVQNALNGLNVVLGTDARLPSITSDPDYLVIEQDSAGNVTRRVARTDGSTFIKLAADATVPFASVTDAPMKYGTDPEFFQVWYDNAQNVVFGLRRDGSVQIGRLYGSLPEDNADPFDIILLIGQSNMSGRGMPISSELNPVDERIWQFPSPENTSVAGQILPASEPLYMHDRPTQSAIRMGPGLEFARHYVKDLPPGRRVLLVPAAHGGTGFSTSSVQPTPSGYTYNVGGTWEVGGAGVNLGEIAGQQALAALAAAPAGSKIVAALWHQGESDSTRSNSYPGWFDALAGYFRTLFGIPDLPFVLGQMNLEGIDINTGKQAINRVHIDTPRRLTRTAFAYGTRGGFNLGDTTHMSAIGQKFMGRSMYLAFKRARLNVTTNEPAPPQNLVAVKRGNTVSVSWTWPDTRVTAYVIEWSSDGGVTWSTAGVTQDTALDCAATITTTGTTIQVRVSVTNEIGTSAPIYTTSMGA